MRSKLICSVDTHPESTDSTAARKLTQTKGGGRSTGQRRCEGERGGQGRLRPPSSRLSMLLTAAGLPRVPWGLARLTAEHATIVGTAPRGTPCPLLAGPSLHPGSSWHVLSYLARALGAAPPQGLGQRRSRSVASPTAPALTSATGCPAVHVTVPFTGISPVRFRSPRGKDLNPIHWFGSQSPSIRQGLPIVCWEEK